MNEDQPIQSSSSSSSSTSTSLNILGIKNPGSLCYLISLIQILFHSSFSEHYLSSFHSYLSLPSLKDEVSSGGILLKEKQLEAIDEVMKEIYSLFTKLKEVYKKIGIDEEEESSSPSSSSPSSSPSPSPSFSLSPHRINIKRLSFHIQAFLQEEFDVDKPRDTLEYFEYILRIFNLSYKMKEAALNKDIEKCKDAEEALVLPGFNLFNGEISNILFPFYTKEKKFKKEVNKQFKMKKEQDKELNKEVEGSENLQSEELLEEDLIKDDDSIDLLTWLASLEMSRPERLLVMPLDILQENNFDRILDRYFNPPVLLNLSWKKELIDNSILSLIKEKKISGKSFERVSSSSSNSSFLNQLYSDHSLDRLSLSSKRKIRLKNSPKLLLLHLRRFSYSIEYDCKLKLHNKIVFPFHLDLSQYLESQNKSLSTYSLKGLILHDGETAYNGHYFSIVNKDGVWFELNDHKVVQVTEDQLGELAYGTYEPSYSDQDSESECDTKSSSSSDCSSSSIDNSSQEISSDDSSNSEDSSDDSSSSEDSSSSDESSSSEDTSSSDLSSSEDDQVQKNFKCAFILLYELNEST